MESEIIKIASSQGVWTVLSVVLIFYIVKTQEKRDIKQEEREKNYQQIILKLTDNSKILENIKNGVDQITDYMYNKKT